MSDQGGDPLRDPLRDPDFPDRPQHPDYWRLVDVISQLDAAHTEDHRSMPDIVGGDIDTESLVYMARMRTMKAQQLAQGPVDPRLTALLASVWIDGLITGVRYQQAGGHRQPDPTPGDGT